MTNDLDDLIDGEDEATDEAPTTPEVEATDNPETDEAEAEATSEEGEETNETSDDEDDADEENVTPEPQSVPLAAFLENQNKLKAELAAKTKELDEAKAKQAAAPDFNGFYKQAPENIPSVLDDEQGFQAAQTAAMEASSFNTRFSISANYAQKTYGEEVVGNAIAEFNAAAEANPLLKQALDNSSDPVGEIVSWSEDNRIRTSIKAAGGMEGYEKALREKIVKELTESGKINTAEDNDKDEATPTTPVPNMPGNFNKASKGGGNKAGPIHSTLDELLT